MGAGRGAAGPAVVLPLWVSLFDRGGPDPGRDPFFYWFQILLIFVAVGLTVPAYLLSQRAERPTGSATGCRP